MKLPKDRTATVIAPNKYSASNESRTYLNDLLHQLQKLWHKRREEVNSKWSRTLPLADYIVDRWEKAKLLGFGREASIYDSSVVLGDVQVGEHTWIGPFTVLDGSAGLSIGEYCTISTGVQIYTHDTVGWAISGGKEAASYSPTVIGSRCYIGPNTIIVKNVTIGDGCIIGANSLVLNDIPPNSKAYGSPCRVLGPADTASQS